MKWWIIPIVLFLGFVIFVLLRMDWSELRGEMGEGDFMGALKAIGDACCLGTIFKR